MSELIDIFDADRRPTGRTAPRAARLLPGEHRLVVHICIFNSCGELLIQRRADKKRSFGGKWDVSAGGHAVAGENSASAASRELFEELGLRCDFSHTDAALCVNFRSGFDDFYFLEREVNLNELTLQSEEVSEVRWATLEELYAMIDSGEFINYYKSFFALIFDMRKKPESGLLSE